MPPGIGYGPRLPTLGRMPNVQLPQPGAGAAPGPQGLMSILQRPGIREALMRTGMGLLAQSDHPGSLGGALGRALPQGMQAYRQGQQQAALDEVLQNAPPEMQRLLGALPRGQRAMAAFQMMQGQQAPEPVSLDQGDVLVDPRTGEEVARNEAALDEPSAVRTFRAIQQMEPDQREAFVELQRSLQSPGTTVNVGQQDPAAEALVGIEAGEVKSAMEKARTARNQLSSLREIESLLDEGVETGAAEEALLPAREIAAAFGVGDVDQLIKQQNFRALTNEVAIGMTQNLEGQISEKELDFVRAAVPNIGTTPEANKRIVEIGKRANETAIDVAEAKREYFRENGNLRGFEPIRREIVQENLLDELPEPESGTSPAAGMNPQQRIQELSHQGLSPEEVIEIGREEGWVR